HATSPPFPYTTLFRSHSLPAHHITEPKDAQDYKNLRPVVDRRFLKVEKFELCSPERANNEQQDHCSYECRYDASDNSGAQTDPQDRKSTRLNSSHVKI